MRTEVTWRATRWGRGYWQRRYLNSRKHTVRDGGQSEYHLRRHRATLDAVIGAVLRAIRRDRSPLARLVLAVYAHNLFTGPYVHTGAGGVRHSVEQEGLAGMWFATAVSSGADFAADSIVRSPPRRRLVRRVATTARHLRVLGGHYGLRVSQIPRCKHPVARSFIEAPVDVKKRFAYVRYEVQVGSRCWP